MARGALKIRYTLHYATSSMYRKWEQLYCSMDFGINSFIAHIRSNIIWYVCGILWRSIKKSILLQNFEMYINIKCIGFTNLLQPLNIHNHLVERVQN